MCSGTSGVASHRTPPGRLQLARNVCPLQLISLQIAFGPLGLRNRSSITSFDIWQLTSDVVHNAAYTSCRPHPPNHRPKHASCPAKAHRAGVRQPNLYLAFGLPERDMMMMS